uniref:phospholipase D n=1 Tax=Chenopodium quinoa TaxID=63459 RepID=A0A803M1G1_CHEQI
MDDSVSMEGSQHGQGTEFVPFQTTQESLENLLLHGHLDIWVKEAKKLPNMDQIHKTMSGLFGGRLSMLKSHGTSDPYVTVSIAGAIIARTFVIPDNENPMWMQHFFVPVAHTAPELHFVVKDDDVGRSEIIGAVVVHNVRLVRDDPNLSGVTLGDLLKGKAQEGVRVLVLVWDDPTSRKFFHRTTEAGAIYTHHQKTVIVDADADKVPNIIGQLDANHTCNNDDDDDMESWHVQVFRSIDSNSVKAFPKDPKDGPQMNLYCGKNVLIDMSIHTAYVHAIRSAQHFIYIENQYFLARANNLIPIEIALKIAEKIKADERFVAYIVLPMWPEGIFKEESTIYDICSFKSMIVDDEYVIMGSANINQRSMEGTRDTEIAMGAYQPHYTWASRNSRPHGQIYGYRMSLWSEHLGTIEGCFMRPESLECVRRVRILGEQNWIQFSIDQVTEMKGHLLKYPLKVDRWGRVCPLPGSEKFPDLGGKVMGTFSGIQENLTI